MGVGHAHALYVHGHSRVHRLPAHVKLIAAFTTTVVIATTPNDQMIAFIGFAAILILTARVAEIRVGFLLPRLVVVLPFLLAALLLPWVASGPRVDVLGLSLAREGITGGIGLAARAILGATTSLLLVATTEVPELLRGLERLRVPPILTQIAAFMIRYIEVIAGDIQRQRRAMTARGYDPRWLWQIRPLTIGLGVLFVRSYERGERIHRAMLARGFTGHMPRLTDEGPVAVADWARALSLPAAAVAIRGLAAISTRIPFGVLL